MIAKRIGTALAAAWLLAPLLLTGAPAGAVEEDPAWSRVRLATQGAPQVIGSYSNGCIAGAVQLPPEGPGYQIIRLSRNRNWGHPTLVATLADLGRRAQAAGLPPILIADMGQPRGGPITDHAAHENGLDADIWLRLDLPMLARDQRETLKPEYITGPWTDYIPRGALSPQQAQLIRLAATEPRVERIFIHPAIKRELCAMNWDDRSWLHVVRPWTGHNEHLHIRIGCPSGSPLCREQDPAPPGDGCGADLMSWFPMRAPVPKKGGKPYVPPPLPAACMAVLNAPAVTAGQ
ncbi:penicillin-insensitive murein endopeptidase [Inquilinus limosus]|uniref:penicillin-insensitive murein endopeptidase n=1 Tax=Inquilinus limosus TaxID=171674 RepID=UPI0006898636|nr:penicillin-insensitive murein endopeptidase [Inquilinus limosus]